MPRPKKSAPSYCLHKPSGNAYVTLNGKQRWLGKHNSPKSLAEYDRIIGEYLSNGRRLVEEVPEGEAGYTISMMLLDFLEHAQDYYKNSSEIHCFKSAMRPLKKLYGHTNAAQFGPKKLTMVQGEMIRMGWARKSINKQIGRLKFIFRWAAKNEVVPASVFHATATVDGLRRGKSEAKESPGVKPVHSAHVEAIKPYVSRQVWAMIQLQDLTGMRPGELVIMRGIDLEMARGSTTWIYRPKEHKTAHHDHDREIRVGPRAREVLQPFLKSDPNAYIFSPKDAEAERHQKQRENRKTPVQPSQVARTKAAKRRKRGRAPRGYYTVDSYRRAIARACEIAFDMPADLERNPKDSKAEAEARAERRRLWRNEHVWHPHQLRHSCATRLRKDYGIEAARLVLGHRSAAITEIYAERDAAKAEEIMAAVG